MADRSVTVALHSTGITGYTSEVATASRETLALDRSMRAAGKAADSYTRAVAAAGAESNRAVAAQVKYSDSLKRVAIAENDVALAAARAAEAQVRASERAAAAQEAAARKQRASMMATAKVSGYVAAGTVLALGLAAKAAADFNSKLAVVQSLTHASAGTVDALTKATQGYASIGVSASEAADAEIELIKAGVGVKDILGGGLAGTLNLAAAGQTDVATATEIASAAMVQFGLSGSAIPHIADLLSTAADRSLGSVTDLGEGLKAVGTTASQAGLSIDQTTASLAEFAAAGLTGSLGGTAFKQMLLKLEAPSAKAAALTEQYGLSLYDAGGHIVSMTDLAGQLHDKLGGLTDAQRNAALATIFGSRAVQAANILYADGAKGAAGWAQKVQDSGHAADQARGKMNSLTGDMQKLGAQAMNDAIAFGQELQPALRAATQDLTAILGVVGDLPGPLKEAAALTVAFTAAVSVGTFAYTKARLGLLTMGSTLGVVSKETTAAGTAFQVANAKMLAFRGGAAAAGGALLMFHSQIGHTDQALGALSQAAAGAALGFAVTGGPWGAAIGGSIGLLAGLDQMLGSTHRSTEEERASVDALTASLNRQNGAITSNTRAQVAKSFSDAGLIDDAKKVGLSLNDLVNLSMKPTTNSWQALSLAIQKTGVVNEDGDAIFVRLGHAIADQSGDVTTAKQAWLAYLQVINPGAYKRIMDAHIASMHHLGGAVDDLGQSLGGAGHSFYTAAAGVAHLGHEAALSYKELVKLDNLALGRQGAWDNFNASVDAATAALKKNGNALDSGTAKGRANRAVLRDIASSTLALAADYKRGSDGQVAALEKGRQALYDQEIAFGRGKVAARAYVDEVLGIPTSWKTRFDVDTVAALAKLHALQRAEEAIRSKTVQINVDYRQLGGVGGHVVYGQAEGGPVRGPGTGTSDSVLRALSNGEFVVKTAAVDYYGLQKMHAINQMQAPIQGLAGGGPASGQYMSATREQSFVPMRGGDSGLVSALRDIAQRVSRVEKGLHDVHIGKPVDLGDVTPLDARALGIARGVVAGAGAQTKRLGLVNTR